MDKFIYIYSDIYQFHHEYVSKCLSQANIPFEAIKIDDIGKTRGTCHTFAGGVSIKLELLVKCIEDNIDHDIVFSDVTIGFNPDKINMIKEYFNRYKDYDLCWVHKKVPTAGYNIGITKTKCNLKMLDFFQEVRDIVLETKGWDQGVCNDVYSQRSSNINFKTFSDKIIGQGSVCLHDPQVREKFYIWKQLIAHKGRTPEEIVSARIQQLKDHRLLI